MIFFVFLIGIIIGSFINVFIDRTIQEESIIYPPSHCDYCNSRLKIRNLIPIISFLIQKGKCTYCGKKIKIQYPIIEFITGAIFSINYFFIEDITIALLISSIISLLLGMSIIDIKTKDIYLTHLAILFIINIALVYFNYWNMKDLLYRIVFLSLFIIIGYYLSKNGKLGFGDILIIVILMISFSFDEILIYLLNLSILSFFIGIILLIKIRDFEARVI